MSDLAAELRRQFDESFQFEPRPATQEEIELLVIRVSGRPYALRLSEVQAVVKEKAVTPLPGAPAGIRGVTGFRGRLVIVQDLAFSLGLGAQSGGWLALVPAPENSRLGLAFDSVETQIKVAPEQLLPNQTQAHVQALVQRSGGPLSLLSIASVVSAVVGF